METPSREPTTPIKKFDAELEHLSEDMFASMYLPRCGSLPANRLNLRLPCRRNRGKNPESKNRVANLKYPRRRRKSAKKKAASPFQVFAATSYPQFVTIKSANAKGESFEIRAKISWPRFCTKSIT